eukprot:TRINITY_DN4175_c0_g1_i6.p2 TRINITY_DN4175_c0_g1~~TRINITY_DN4175_c0_g1_i6.p2  ORF type:complete len:109 (-),score=2.52 TRINITY_DN4175_c0_g1_i6:284-610(-)
MQNRGCSTLKSYLMNKEKKISGPIQVQNGERILLWRDNDFPYYLEDGIEHHVLWCTEPLQHEEILQVIQQYREGYETTYFVNPPQLQSIKGVWHAHVLSRIANKKKDA